MPLSNGPEHPAGSDRSRGQAPDAEALAKASGKSTLQSDLLSSIVVFLVALPLCLGIAIASGAPPMLGLISGIIGGLVVGSFSGVPLQVSGPAAGLVTLVYEIIETHGLEGLGIIVLVAGLLQIVAGALKLGQWFRAIAPAVIQGMLAGIGVLIVASQFHVMMDIQPESSGIANLMTIPESVMKGLFPLDNSKHHIAAMIGAMTICIILAWNFVPKKLKLVPAALIAILISVAVAAAFDLPVKFISLPGSIMETIHMPSAGSLQLLTQGDVWIMIFTIALVASAETMLSATAVDQMHEGPRARYEKEMIAQGIGNTIAGFFGAMPITGVIVRSSANIQAGAKTRLSAILHGAWLLALVLLFPFLMEYIPTSALAAVLVYTGYKLVNPKAIKKLAQIGKGEVIIYFATMVMIVATNLLEGVIVGVVLSLIKLLYTFSHLESRSVWSEDNRVDLLLKGSATFLSLPNLSAILERQPPGKDVHVHIEDLAHIDHACIELLQSWERQYRHTGGQLTVEWHGLTDRFSKSGESAPDQRQMAAVEH